MGTCCCCCCLLRQEPERKQVPAVVGIVSVDRGGGGHTGRHGRVQINIARLTCCPHTHTLCDLHPTSASLIPLYLFLYIVVYFLPWGGMIGRWLKKQSRACFSLFSLKNTFVLVAAARTPVFVSSDASPCRHLQETTSLLNPSQRRQTGKKRSVNRHRWA